VPVDLAESTRVSKAPKGCCTFGTPTNCCVSRTVHLTPWFPGDGRKATRLAVLFPLCPVGGVLKANELIERPAGREHREHESGPSENQNQHIEWFEFGCHNGRRRKALEGVSRRFAFFPSLLCPPHHSRFPCWLGPHFGNHLRSAGLAAFKLPSLTRSPRQPCSNITVSPSDRYVGVVTVAR